MHGVARAALDGLLDVGRLQAMDAAAAMTEVQRIKGIVPFYATLIVVRATGCTDVLAASEPRLRALVRELYRLPDEPSETELEAIATIGVRGGHGRPCWFAPPARESSARHGRARRSHESGTTAR